MYGRFAAEHASVGLRRPESAIPQVPSGAYAAGLTPAEPLNRRRVPTLAPFAQLFSPQRQAGRFLPLAG